MVGNVRPYTPAKQDIYDIPFDVDDDSCRITPGIPYDDKLKDSKEIGDYIRNHCNGHMVLHGRGIELILYD